MGPYRLFPVTGQEPQGVINPVRTAFETRCPLAIEAVASFLRLEVTAAEAVSVGRIENKRLGMAS